MYTLLVFPTICIFLAIFSWVVTFFYPERPARTLVISLSITLVFVAAEVWLNELAPDILLQSSFALAPVTAVFVTYALYRRLGYTRLSYAWLRALLLFLVCALGMFALAYACFFLILRHHPLA